MTERARPHPDDPMEQPAPVPDAYLGVWQRTLLETPCLRDTRSQVWWLQTTRWHADLRIPPGRPDFSGVHKLADCSDAQLAWLATQEGFCGFTQVNGNQCIWHRQIDFQPASGRRDIGRMAFDGEHVTETGVEADYLERWKRLPQSRGGSAALELLTERGELPARSTWLLIAGNCFIFVRGRAHPRSGSRHGTADLAGQASGTRRDRTRLLGWLDMEISLGYLNGTAPGHIRHSTLPFREGHCLIRPGALQRMGHQIVTESDDERRWRILDWSLEASG